MRDVLELHDVVFDLAITPNRPDAMSMVGVARELAAHFGLALSVPEPTVSESGEPTPSLVTVEVDAPDRCPRFTARCIEVTMGPSPEWLARRLTLAGMRPISNVVDVTNYVMLERGQPLHAFDLERLPGRGLVVRMARDDERLTTLDGVERVLTAEDLLICDAERGVQSIAGIMGGAAGRGARRHDGDPARGRLLHADGHLEDLEAARAAVRGERALRARHRPERRARGLDARGAAVRRDRVGNGRA